MEVTRPAFDVKPLFQFRQADGPHTLHLRAADDKGNTSAVFDFSFTLDTHSPTVPPARVNPGQIQRSRIDRIKFDLSEDLATTLLAGNLRLVRNGAVSTPITVAASLASS